MYEKEIKRVGELVYGPGRMSIGLAICQAARESGVAANVLAAALRSRRTTKEQAAQARETYRKTVPNRMVEEFEKR